MVKLWVLCLLGVLDMAEFDPCPACGSEVVVHFSFIWESLDRVFCRDCGHELSPAVAVECPGTAEAETLPASQLVLSQLAGFCLTEAPAR